MKTFWPSLVGLLFFPLALLGQQIGEEQGFELGIFHIRPGINALGAYDNRVVESGGDAKGDFYSELGASVAVENTEARYGISGNASYGCRNYDEYTALNDDFYAVGASISSTKDPLKLGVSSYMSKSLDYDTAVDMSSGKEPGEILTAGSSSRISSKADVGYEQQLKGDLSILPSYGFWHYFQDFEDRSDAEWQTHSASLLLGYGYTGKTILTLSTDYSLQVNSSDNDDGTVATVAIGAKSRATDKISWSAEIGLAAADYEQSGSDQGVVVKLRGMWAATEKISTYVFGGNDFQPGYGGGSARMVYRLGYGAEWRVVSRWSFGAQVLHDYEDGVGESSSDPGVGEMRHFLTAQTSYDLTKHVALSLAGNYVKDEYATDQTIVSLRIGYSY